MKKWILAMLATLFSFQASAAPIILTPTNSLVLRQEVDDDVVSRLILQMTESNEKTLYLYINSPGGSITAGNNLINAMHGSGKKIICIADFAASMAFSIFQQCDVRLITDTAVIMQHQASTEVKGNVTKLKVELEILEKMARALNEGDSKRLGMTLKDFQAKIHDEWWLICTDAIEAHAADDRTDVRCSKDLAKAHEVQTIQSLFGVAELTWSSCPLATYPVSVKMKMRMGVDPRDFNSWVEGLSLDQNWKTHQDTK